MASKRNVHHSQATAVSDVDSQSDSDCEDERVTWGRLLRGFGNFWDFWKDGSTCGRLLKSREKLFFGVEDF